MATSSGTCVRDFVCFERNLRLAARDLALRPASVIGDEVQAVPDGLGEIVEDGIDDEVKAESVPAPQPQPLWYYVQPLESKKYEEIISGLRLIVNTIESEFAARSVFRLHADQAQELTV